MLEDGKPVRDVNEFCEYLRAKDPRIEEVCDMEGSFEVNFQILN